MTRPTLESSSTSYAWEWDSASPVMIPHRLGAYRLYLELASGGMASVHLARKSGRTGSRFVALKRIHPHLASEPAFMEMFSDEARIASLIHHPNVCSVLDFDCAGGEYFLAMEFLVGESLSAVFRAMVLHPHEEGRAPSRAALVAKVIADACEGLHAAHELRDPQGEPLDVVHRDISPENLFVTYDGVVKVVDFGVARASDQQHLTVPGVIKGKLAYMPPEVLRGSPPDRRADIWAIGCVLWELLTGARLFHRASDIETLTRLTEGHVPRPSKVAPDVPADFDEIVEKALAWHPEARYATARDLAKDLTLALARRGDAVGLAELAEWMDELFPGAAAKKRRMLETAASMDASVVDSDSETRLADLSALRARTIPPPPLPEPPGGRATTIRPPVSQCAPLPVPSTLGEVQSERPLLEPLPLGSSRSRVQKGVIGALVAALCTAAFTLGLVHARAEVPAVTPPLAEAPSPASALRLEPPSGPVMSTAGTIGAALPLGPGSYAVEIEASHDEPGTFLLRLRPTPAQHASSQ